MSAIKGVLFDMDGVLLDSEEYMNRAGVELFREKGFTVSPDDFYPFTGMGEDRYLGGVADQHGIPFNAEKDKKRAYEIYADLVRARLEPLPGVPEFIDRCKMVGLRLAVATSADRIKMEINLREIGLDEHLFDATVNGLEIERKKPAPDIFIKAAEKLGLAPAQCLVVEDAVSGVEAGKAAGSRVLALTTTFSAEELSQADWIECTLSDVPDEVLNW
jgi:HAD superfamily hydrolase (TIGR01509 family)